jgi:predicted O-methyltransferase YrrM
MCCGDAASVSPESRRSGTRDGDGAAAAPAASGTLAKLANYGRRLLQPQYWPELRRLTVRRLKGRPMDENTAERARTECARLAMSREEAFRALGFPHAALRSFRREEAARLDAAELRVSSAPGGMGGGADMDLLYSLCLATGATRVLETGVAFGWSSLAILSAISRDPAAELISIDLPYLGAKLDTLVGLAVPNDLRRQWSLRHGADRDELPGAVSKLAPLDLAHYDSDKSYLGRRWAYPLIWSGLRDGGMLISDDVEDNMAFLDFAADVGVSPVIARAPDRSRLAGVLRKPVSS